MPERESDGVILTALLLTVLALALCAAAVRKLFLALGLDLGATLLWLGLAEVPVQRAPRRPEPAARPLRLVS